MSERVAGRVEGKVALVTGGASGIGRATAARLAAEGAQVVITDINEEAGRQAAKEIGGETVFLPHDVSDEESWQQVLGETLDRFGRLDVLVNNAGIVVAGTIEDTTVEQFQRIQDVNSLGVFLGCKHAIPAMRRGDGGSIVNLSSLAALRGTPPYAAYSASKGAVHALTKTVAAHCAGLGDLIRCNSIHPGGVDTPMVHAVVKESAGLAPDATLPPKVLENLAEPREIADLVLYLASDESRFMNGAELCIDGGSSAIPGVPGGAPT